MAVSGGVGEIMDKSKISVTAFGMFVTPIFLALSLWGLFGFIAWEWDVRQWVVFGRLIYGFSVSVVAAVFWGALILMALGLMEGWRK